MEKMRENGERFKAIWNYLIMKFQNHLKNRFVFHKRSIKLVKKRKYKNPMGNSQTVRKFTLPKEFEKDFYVKQKQKRDKRQKDEEEKSKPKEVRIGDILPGAAAAS